MHKSCRGDLLIPLAGVIYGFLIRRRCWKLENKNEFATKNAFLIRSRSSVARAMGRSDSKFA